MGHREEERDLSIERFRSENHKNGYEESLTSFATKAVERQKRDRYISRSRSSEKEKKPKKFKSMKEVSSPLLPPPLESQYTRNFKVPSSRNVEGETKFEEEPTIRDRRE